MTLVPSMFAEHARRHPERIAVEAIDGTFTFGQLDEASWLLARELAGRGVGPDVVVGIRAARDFRLVVAILAVWRAGGGFLLLDPAEPAGRDKYKLDAAGVTIFAEAAGGTLADPTVPGPESLAYVVFTSGSTGRPKGVMIEHGGLTEHVLTQLAPHYEAVTADGAVLRVGGAAPVTFDSFVDQLLPMIALGHTLVLFDERQRLDPGSFLDRGLHVVDCAPSQLAMLVQHGLLVGAQPPRLIVFGGEKPDQRTWDALRASGTHAVSIYGATEVTVGSFEAEVHGYRRVTLGRPAGSASAYLLDPQGHPAAPGEAGEIYLAGPGVGRGYAADPELTAAAYLPDPFSIIPGARMYRTGDLGRIRAEGDWEFMGRIDDQLKIRGYRIEPGEIEAALEGLPEVRRAAVVPISVGGVPSYLVAFVEAASTDGLLPQLSAILPQYLVPSKVIGLTRLPLTHNGKIDRVALAESYVDIPMLGEPPANEMEQQVHDVWREVLGVDSVGVTDDLVSVGGHSLAAVQIVLRLQAIVSHPLDVARLLTTRTVRDMAVAATH